MIILCISATPWTKVFSHDTAGGLFTSNSDAISKNSENPDANLFSVLNQLETLRLADGSFHLKICYPELGDCNEWTQTSNPATDSTILGFKAITLGFPKNSYREAFGGLGVSPASDSTTFIDDTPNQSFWFYPIGAKVYYGSNTIPGPVSEDGTRHKVKRVDFFVETPGMSYTNMLGTVKTNKSLDCNLCHRVNRL